MPKPEFFDDAYSERESTLDAHRVDFDYDSVDRALGNQEQEEQADTGLLASMLREIGREIGRCKTFEQAGRKFLKLANAAKGLDTPEAKMIQGLAKWVMKLRPGHHQNQYGRSRSYRVGQRAIVVFWLTNADNFEGGPSLTELSRSFGISTASLSMITSEASRYFGIVARSQDVAAQARHLKGHAARGVEQAHKDNTVELCRGIFGERKEAA